MVTYKDTVKKTTTPKRNIKVDCVSIEDGYLVDENGNIAQGIKESLPPGVEEFTIKISVNLPDEDDDE